MKCFVIMPFDTIFNDVYAIIKTTCEGAVPGEKITCRQLDEIMRPGRISDDLIKEINEATFCVADLSGNNPNVMWEVGYAMALSKPIVFLSQNVDNLPFDIRDMRTIHYNRQSLSDTLQTQLSETIRQTLGEHEVPRTDDTFKPQIRNVRTIAITGSMKANAQKCRDRVPVILQPYLGKKILWYCGSNGTADEYALEYLIKEKQDISVVGYHSFDISNRILQLIKQYQIPFIDARKEQLSGNIHSPSERDMFFLNKSDLQILLWNGGSSGTLRLIEWYKRHNKDFIVGFI